MKKQDLKTINIQDYISQKGLDSIRTLEGHFSGVQNGSIENDKNIKTTYYGITQNGINGVRELEKKFNIKIPEYIKTAKVENITEKQAREIAGYHAVLLTEKINQAVNDNSFMNLTLSERSALLTYLHSTGVDGMIRSSKNPKNKGSLINAIKTNNIYNIGKALITKEDGSTMTELNDGNRGMKNRILATISMMFDPDASFETVEARDEMYNRYSATSNIVKNMNKCLNLLSEVDGTDRMVDFYRGEDKRATVCSDVRIDPVRAATRQSLEMANESKVQQEQNTEDSFMNQFVKTLKKLFTNNNEEKSL